MSDLKINREEDVLILTFNRPERLNAMSKAMKDDLIEVLRTEAKKPRARAIVLTGAGKGFCSGADLDPDTIMSRVPHMEHQIRTGVNEIIRLIRDMPVPVIAVVNGAAAGAGCSLAIAADIILAGESAKFALTFVRVGAVLDGGVSQILAQKIGLSRATALALTGDLIDAETALDWGLVYKTIKDETLWEESMALAQRLASGPSLALGLIKREIAVAQNSSLEEVLKFEASSQARAFASDDFREGVAAFSQKRKPVFRGS